MGPPGQSRLPGAKADLNLEESLCGGSAELVGKRIWMTS
jgi:hypothetical protein